MGAMVVAHIGSSRPKVSLLRSTRYMTMASCRAGASQGSGRDACVSSSARNIPLRRNSTKSCLGQCHAGTQFPPSQEWVFLRRPLLQLHRAVLEELAVHPLPLQLVEAIGTAWRKVCPGTFPFC